MPVQAMSALFEACKQVAAVEVARQAGLKLNERGRRAWACCPLHGEKTPSLMFDEHGKWHCFGCSRGGDAVAFYAELYKLPMIEAAKQLAAHFGLSGEPMVWTHVPVPPARHLQEMLEDWYWDEWDRACRLKHAAQAHINAAYAQGSLSAVNYPDSFYKWVAAKAFAECRLDDLLQASLYERADMMLEERNEHTQTV